MQSVLNTSTPIQTAIRTVFVTMDMGVYYLLHFVYELIFTIASINLLDREMIYNIFSRLQLVIGIFMMFRLIMIILKGIASPDTVSDSKSGGAGSLVVRIIVSLAMLALIVPIHVPSPANEYEKQINNNGILFGTLYSLQYRLLKNNTIGKIILGNTDTETTNETTEIMGYEVFGLRRDANKFTSTILKTFYQLNKDSETNQYVCNDGWDETYNKEDIEPALIIVNAIQVCGTGNTALDVADDVAGVLTLGLNKNGRQYRLTINWLSTIVGIILLVVFFMLAFNVAVRVFKLSALQLIAPIPIISYMDPKGSKDGAFQAWVKLLGTIYAELFIQLGVIYFSLAVINAFITRFFSVENAASAIQEIGFGDPLTATALIGFIFIIMVIALFVFAKDAPKFFKQMLGIKDDGKGFLSNFGTAMGLGVSAVGAAGSFTNSRDAGRTRDIARARARGMSEADATAFANRNRGKHLLSGALGAVMGVATGSAAASESKGNPLAKAMAAVNAQSKYNRKVSDAAENGAGLFDALQATGEKVTRGQSPHEREAAQLKRDEQANKAAQTALKNRSDALKTAQSNNALRDANDKRAMDKAKDNDSTYGSYGGLQNVNWKQFNSRHEASKSGSGVHTVYTTTVAGLKSEITKDEYDHLDVTVQHQYTDSSYFEVDNQVTGGVERVLTRDAESLSFGLLKANAGDLYNESVKHQNGQTSRAHDDVIITNRRIYHDSTGHDMEDTYENMRNAYAAEKETHDREAAAINREQQRISEEDRRISERRQSYQYRHGESADNYITGNGKSSNQ